MLPLHQPAILLLSKRVLSDVVAGEGIGPSTRSYNECNPSQGICYWCHHQDFSWPYLSVIQHSVLRPLTLSTFISGNITNVATTYCKFPRIRTSAWNVATHLIQHTKKWYKHSNKLTGQEWQIRTAATTLRRWDATVKHQFLIGNVSPSVIPLKQVSLLLFMEMVGIVGFEPTLHASRARRLPDYRISRLWRLKLKSLFFMRPLHQRSYDLLGFEPRPFVS